MTRTLIAQPLTAEAFAPYGDLLEATGTPDKIINRGHCGRFHDRAMLDFGPEGRAGISVFHGDVVAWPVEVALVERHPEGSQAFISMTGHPFLVVGRARRRRNPWDTAGVRRGAGAGHQLSSRRMARGSDPAS